MPSYEKASVIQFLLHLTTKNFKQNDQDRTVIMQVAFF